MELVHRCGKCGRPTTEELCPACRRKSRKGRMKDITGQRFGHLVAIEPAVNYPSSSVHWHCVCDCGTTLIVSGYDLRTGRRRHCGCMKGRKEEGAQ